MTLTIDLHASERRTPKGDVSRLVNAAAGGDETAWNQLVETYSGLIWAIARSHRLNDADAADTAQRRGFTCSSTSVTSTIPTGSEPGWLPPPAASAYVSCAPGTVKCHTATSRLSRSTPGRASRKRFFTGERDAALWAAFGRLRPSDRALLRLLMADPQPRYEEISAALDMPIGSIGPTRVRALDRLRGELRRDGLESAAAL